MRDNIKVASYPPECKPKLIQRKLKQAKANERRLAMPLKSIVLCLVVICITILAFTLMTRNTLCELRIKDGDKEVAAVLACDSGR